ncbi:hypothetical protein DOTSEDRAFT_71468 [Dothistroma septosporum NZE10]|uniref:Uncharacterized protein n=1 Tax=Dothistroma septosporum (strain NZE10 / CBS 128990) TaxID=675120 RepID=N1PTQ1_DOTSN|nr:hypothetical protein DOTSEDRAFT_71468 [Dothistroma septosporum NZE10]
MSGIILHRGRMCIHANQAFRAMRDVIASSSMRQSADARQPIRYPTYDGQAQVRGMRRRVWVQTLSSILKIVQNRGCADPRDRIFGILGLVDWHNYEIPVHAEYSMTRLQIAVRSIAHLSNNVSSLYELDLRVLLETLELEIHDATIHQLICARRVPTPPQDDSSPSRALRRFMGASYKIAAVNRERRWIPHGGGAPLDPRDMILDPQCDMLQGDVAVEECCSDGDQFVLRWSCNHRWNIIGIARFTTGIRTQTKSEQTESYSIFLDPEDLLVWYYLKTNFAAEVISGGRVRIAAHASYALAGPANDSDGDSDSDQEMPLSDPDIF